MSIRSCPMVVGVGQQRLDDRQRGRFPPKRPGVVAILPFSRASLCVSALSACEDRVQAQPQQGQRFRPGIGQLLLRTGIVGPECVHAVVGDIPSEGRDFTFVTPWTFEASPDFIAAGGSQDFAGGVQEFLLSSRKVEVGGLRDTLVVQSCLAPGEPKPRRRSRYTVPPDRDMPQCLQASA